MEPTNPDQAAILVRHMPSPPGVFFLAPLQSSHREFQVMLEAIP